MRQKVREWSAGGRRISASSPAKIAGRKGAAQFTAREMREIRATVAGGVRRLSHPRRRLWRYPE